MPEQYPPTVALVRLAVERVAGDPEDEQRYLELNFALDRAVERDLRYRELFEVFEEGAPAATPDVRWAWRLAAGLTANLRGDTQAAVRWLEQAREDLEQAGNPRGVWANTAAGSFLHGELARAYYHLASHASGVEAATRALQVARAAASTLAEAYAHHYLGLISLRQRDYPYAERHITAARELFERMNQRHGRARVLDSLASLAMDRGEYGRARAWLEESLGVKQELRDLRGQALTCGNLARLYTALGDFPQAMHYLDRERELTSRVGDERNATQVHIEMGRILVRHGDPNRAAEELRAAAQLARARGDQRLEAFACFTLAEAERRLGNREACLSAIQTACDYFLAADDPVMRDRAILRRAIVSGQPLESDEVQGALERLRSADAPGPLTLALFETASYYHSQGQVAEVTPLYAEALDVAEPVLASQLAAIMRNRAQGVEGRAWVDAMLAVKEQKDKLETALSELQHGERLRASLLQMIVHDLKNPLTAITPWLQTIQMGVLSADETEVYLQGAIDECHYLLRMIEDLNDVGKMQHAGRLEVEASPVALQEILEEVSRRLEARARDGGMTIVLEEPSNGWSSLPPVPADPEKLRRVLENLVANAVKYGRPPEGSDRPAEVHLRAVVEPPSPEGGSGSVRVEVRDYGVGIPAAEAERVFEPYYQAEAGRKRKAGVGLGLAFCRLAVEAHGGTIWTQPNPDGGTVFAFRLPLGQA